MARKQEDEAHLEEKIDEAIEGSFPASDPPFWTLGVPREEPPSAVREPDSRTPVRPTHV